MSRSQIQGGGQRDAKGIDGLVLSRRPPRPDLEESPRPQGDKRRFLINQLVSRITPPRMKMRLLAFAIISIAIAKSGAFMFSEEVVKMRCFIIITLCFINTFISGYVVDWYPSDEPEWNDLRVKWDVNIFNPYTFAKMPRTTSDAVSAGFKMVSDCGAIPGIYGKRYVQGGDYSLILLYGIHGYIAGIQIGVTKNATVEFPPNKQINHPFVSVDNMYYLTAYFTNPATICTTGRTAEKFASDGTGDSLFIQNGTDAAKNSFVVPKEETYLDSTKWTKGHCFVSMGEHYWYNVTSDMNCDDFFPVFLLYNKGRLNAFGWALGTPMTSNRTEHPPSSVIKEFINPVPQCLLNKAQLSTMHIYLTSTPLENLC
ncbi:uncharacterized protein LOC132545493 [Ylistrum balloti]|uniref:uncharacterized protein LOC132545493 n=1 Tax=Ylistrum balloti TaxID=509963 RepID=UPI0029058450|nr:uncharacterized protein LOC132545493 [Ylistrum balloti]